MSARYESGTTALPWSCEGVHYLRLAGDAESRTRPQSVRLVMIALVAIAYTGKPSARELLDRQNGERQPDELDRRVAGWEGAPKMTADMRCFDPAEASERELADYYRLVLDTGKVDRPDEHPPPHESGVARLRTPLTSRGPSRFWAAYLDGRLIGMANFGFPDDENCHLVIGEIRVHPDQRRRGVGTALLRAALPTMQAEGRRVLTAWGVTVGGAGAIWADALGFRVVHHDVLQMLSIPDTDAGLWQVPAPDGYQLTKWIETAPDDLLDSLCQGADSDPRRTQRRLQPSAAGVDGGAGASGGGRPPATRRRAAGRGRGP